MIQKNDSFLDDLIEEIHSYFERKFIRGENTKLPPKMKLSILVICAAFWFLTIVGLQANYQILPDLVGLIVCLGPTAIILLIAVYGYSNKRNH